MFNNAEVALHIFNIKKEADRLRTLNQIFVKETHAIKQKKPKNSGALLGDEITEQSS